MTRAATYTALLLGALITNVGYFASAHPADDIKYVVETVVDYQTQTVEGDSEATPVAEHRRRRESIRRRDDSGSGEQYTGDGTYYSPSVGTGSCGWDNSDSEKVVALNAPQFGNPANPNASPYCGKKVKITGPNGSTEAKIVDKCPVCKSGDLDMSPAAFDEVGDQDAGRIPITWSFID